MKEARREYVEYRLTELEDVISDLEIAQNDAESRDIISDIESIMKKFENEFNELSIEQQKYDDEDEKYINSEYERSV